jgi:hypothetical protein
MPADMRAFRCAPARANTRTHTRPHAHARTRMHREARLESVLGGQHDHNDPGRGWEAHDQRSASGLGSPRLTIRVGAGKPTTNDPSRGWEAHDHDPRRGWEAL